MVRDLISTPWHQRTGERLAPAVTVAAFAAIWVMGVREWGWLLGFGFGWVPAAMGAALAGLAARYLWLPVLLAVGVVLAVGFAWTNLSV